MSVLDLQNAINKANTPASVIINLNGVDPTGALCWAALQPIVTVSNGEVGVASAIEDARIADKAVAGPCQNILPVPLGIGIMP